MKSFPPELIYVLIFGAILLFNYLVQKAAKRRQAELPQDERPQDELPPDELPQDEPLSETWGRASPTPTVFQLRAASVEPVGRSEAPTASSARPRRRFSRRSLMGTRRGVQNAIVIAAILGPCRAFEQHDVR